MTALWTIAVGAHGFARAGEDPVGVLRASADAYAALTSYQDVGVVVLSVVGNTTFDTAFVKPDRFRFAWQSGHPYPPLRFQTITSIVRMDGAKATTWRKGYGEEPTVQVDESLRQSVAGATGVSAGSAHTIATLLMPHLWDGAPFGTSVLAMTAPRSLPDEDVDGIRCHHLAGLSRRGDAYELWIGVADHLVRRIDRAGQYPSSERRRDLRIDGPIAEAVFATAGVRQ